MTPSTENFLEHIFATSQPPGARDLLIEVRGKTLEPTSALAFLGLIARARGFLRQAGVKPGNRVALLAPTGKTCIAGLIPLDQCIII